MYIHKSLKLAILALFITTLVIFSGCAGITPPINHSPIIISLTANPPSPIEVNQSTVITCKATDQDEDPLTYTWTKTGGTITGSGSTITWTAPAIAGTYTITCIVSDGTDSVIQSLTITVAAPVPVNKPPVINSFLADPITITVGESSTLSWNVTDATSVTIDQTIGSVASIGVIAVSPVATTTYTLTATNTAGSVTAMTTVTVDLNFVISPIEDLAEETISDFIRSADCNGDGEPDFSWNSGYDISFVNQVLHIEINIQLEGDDPGDALRRQWEDGIEGIWSNKYDIADGNYKYPIKLQVNWVNADPHHIVNIHSGSEGNGMYNMLNWYTVCSWGAQYQDEIAAHEAGHMIGLYDEYNNGALDPDTLFTTTNSLMADLGPTRDWHYEQILEWLEAKSGRDLSLVKSPLPPYPLDDRIPNFSDCRY